MQALSVNKDEEYRKIQCRCSEAEVKQRCKKEMDEKKKKGEGGGEGGDDLVRRCVQDVTNEGEEGQGQSQDNRSG